MSKGPQVTGTTNSTQTSSPWGGQVPFLTGGSYPGSWGQIPGTQASVANGEGTSQIDANNQGVLGIMPAAAGLYENFTPQYFSGQTYAAPTAAQGSALQGIDNQAYQQLGNDNTVVGNNEYIANGSMAGQDAAIPYIQASINGQGAGFAPLQGFANNNIGGGINPATATLSNYSSGNELSAGNPNTSGVAQSVLSQVVPSIESQFINGGSLASPQAAYATSQGATAALAPTLFNAYQQEQQNQIGAANTLGSNYLQGGAISSAAAQALGQQQAQNEQALQSAFGQNVQQELTGQALAPQTAQMPYTDLSQLYSSGATDQANQQAAINDAVTRWNYGQTLPYDMLNQYIGEVTGNYGGTTTLNQPILTNPTANAASTLATGASAVGGLASGLGGLMALFSDRRLKTDIQRVGTLDNDLPVYSYRYFGSLVPQIGVMADEVEQVHPEAVYVHPSGFKMVDYGAAVQ